MTKRRLNKWEREVLELYRAKEQKLERELWHTYRGLLKDLEQAIAIDSANYEQMKPYQQTKFKKLVANYFEIRQLLEEGADRIGEQIQDYVIDRYKDGFNHTLYLVEQAIKQPTPIDFVDKTMIRTLLANEIDAGLLSQALYKSREKLARDVQGALMRSYVEPRSYAQIANELASKTEADFHRSMRIARTEGNRRYSQGQLASQQEADRMGIEIQKMWMATLDGRTRQTHQSLDGQIRGIDEDYKSPSGASGKAPGMMGLPGEDINCRCSSVSIVEGIKPTHRRAYNADRKGSKVIEYKNYKEWEVEHGGVN